MKFCTMRLKNNKILLQNISILLFVFFQKVDTACFPIWSFHCYEREFWDTPFVHDTNRLIKNKDYSSSAQNVSKILNVKIETPINVLKEQICKDLPFVQKIWISSGQWKRSMIML